MVLTRHVGLGEQTGLDQADTQHRPGAQGELQRFVIEFFREPDVYLGLQALGLSRGQWLCVPMILAGLALWAWAGRRA